MLHIHRSRGKKIMGQHIVVLSAKTAAEPAWVPMSANRILDGESRNVSTDKGRTVRRRVCRELSKGVPSISASPCEIKART